MWLRGHVRHPLDPLNADEFSTVAAILRRDRGVRPDDWRIASIDLAEPAKAQIAEFDADGTRPPRRTEVICFNRTDNATYRSMVSLSDDRVETFEHIPGVQANFTVDEFVECDRLLRAHPDVVEALRRRGVTDMELVFFDTWTRNS